MSKALFLKEKIIISMKLNKSTNFASILSKKKRFSLYKITVDYSLSPFFMLLFLSILELKNLNTLF